MNKFWKQLSNIGIYSDLPINEQKRTRLLNQIAGLFVLSIIPVIIVLLISGNTLPVLHSTAIFILLIPIFWFHYKRFYQLGKYYTLFASLLLITIHSVIYGIDSGSKYYLLYTFVVSLIIFDRRIDYIILLIFHITTFAIISYLSTQFDPIFKVEGFEQLSFVLTIVLCYFTLDFFKSEQTRIEDETNELVETINNKNTAIRTQQRMLKYQNEALKSTNEELEDAQKSLKESVEDLRTFAYIVSHDLKEPLRMINSYTQLIKRRLKGQLNEETEEFMFYIVDGAKRMKILLDDLLKYATTTNKEAEKEVLDMKDIFSVAIRNLEVPIAETNAEIIIQERDYPPVNGAFSQLGQLFQNIIGNAIKFHRPNDTPTIIIDMERNERYNIFRIQDNGVGIPRDKVDKIFSPFERVGNKEKYKGSGIGLAICKKIVQNHDGKIWVDSDINQGATFFIAFPVIKRKKNTASE